MDIDQIRELLKRGQVKFSREAKRRMRQRKVTLEQIEKAIRTGRIVEERRRMYPYPKCTICGYVDRKIAHVTLPIPQPLHVACAVGNELHIITVYWKE